MSRIDEINKEIAQIRKGEEHNINFFGQNLGDSQKMKEKSMGMVGGGVVSGGISSASSALGKYGTLGIGLLVGVFSGEVRQGIQGFFQTGEGRSSTILSSIETTNDTETIEVNGKTLKLYDVLVDEANKAMTASGYSNELKAAKFYESLKKRMQYLGKTTQIPEGFAVPGETPEAAASRYISQLITQKEEVKKTKQNEMMGPYPDISSSNITPQQLEENVRLQREVRRNPEAFTPQALDRAKQLQESMTRPAGQPLPSIVKKEAKKAAAALPPPPILQPPTVIDPTLGYEDILRQQSIMYKKKKAIK